MRLTTHVLDVTRGVPAAGVNFTLSRLDAPAGSLLDTVTNDDGRTDGPLLDGPDFRPGHYELAFAVGAYFAERDGSDGSGIPYLDIVPIRFGIAAGTGPIHVALLVTPWSYTTYRGS
jgi:hydroxyisourate hydrolase